MIRNKTKIKTIIIFLLVLMPFVMSLTQVKALSYNWIENSSFEDGAGIDFITNGNFETGTLSDGWSGSAGVTISTTVSHSTTHSMRIAYSSGANQIAWFNFSSPIDVSSILNATMWLYQTSATHSMTIYYVYTDDTTTSKSIADVSASWTETALLSGITLSEGKQITAIKIDTTMGATQYYYIDDFSITSKLIGQTTIDEDTRPWYTADGGNGVFGTLTNLHSHSGNYSFQGTYTQLAVVNIIQDINFLDMNYVQEFSFWAKLSVDAVRSVSAYIYYSDGTYDYETKTFTSYMQWTKLTFQDFITTEGKYIKKIIIMISGTLVNTGEIFIDDVSLLASIPLNQRTFEMVFIPDAPLDTTGTYWMSYNTQYICRCYIYDNLGEKTENGTYAVTSSAGFAVDGNFTLGIFQFNLPMRNTYMNEVMTIRAYVYNETSYVRGFEVTVNLQWFSGAFYSPTPSSTAPITPERANLMIDFFTFFLLILALPMMLAVGIGAYTHNGTATVITFFGGLLTTIIIGIVVSYLPWWTILPMVIFLVIVAYGLFSKITSSGGG